VTDTSPDLLATLPEVIAARIRVALPGLRDCRGMAGRFDLDQLKARGVAAPAVLVSRLRIRQDATLAGPHVTWTAQMVAFVLTRDELGLPRDVAAANIVQVLLRLIPDQTWGRPDDLGGAFEAAEEPLITASSEKQALSLSAVTWTQPLALSGLPVAPAILPELYLGQAPRIGAANVEDYTRIGGDE
jgi:hypothetical protein